MITNSTGKEMDRLKEQLDYELSWRPDKWVTEGTDKASGLDYFRKLVQTGGPWDHKETMSVIYGGNTYTQIDTTSYKIHLNVWSNVHYGYVGTEAGIASWQLQEAADAGSYLPFLEDSAGTSSLGDRVSIDIGIQLREQHSPDELTTAIVHQAIIDALPRWNELEWRDEQVQIPPIGVG